MKVIILLSCISTIFSQIDNPESPDYLAILNKKSIPFQAKIDSAVTTYDMLQTRIDYYNFLDSELNTLYQKLLKKLTLKQRENIEKSQRAWLGFRDKEYFFLRNTFTRDSFGSFAIVGIKGKHITIVRHRIIELTNILQAFAN